MVMRGAAAVLIMAISGPSLVGVVCDLVCVHHEHHQAVAAQSCHADGAARFADRQHLPAAESRTFIIRSHLVVETTALRI
jgi:hypothetical protein